MPPKVDPITPYLEAKPAGGVRRMALLSERDFLRWHSLAERVDGSVAPRLHPGVAANRTLEQATDRRLLGASLRRARGDANALAASSQAVILTDVCSFYPSVTPSTAYRALVGLHVGSEVARHAAGMLEGWGSEGYAGLPIGPSGSAIVANAILAPVDSELARWPFVRWVDDYAIGLRESEVPGALERLDLALSHRGLERAAAKTRILAGGRSVPWLGTYGRREASE